MPFTTLAWKLWGLSVLALALKMLVLASLTSRQRLAKRVFASPEDYATQGLAAQSERDADVERYRRAHRNDLENILPFFVVDAGHIAWPRPRSSRVPSWRMRDESSITRTRCLGLPKRWS